MKSVVRLALAVAALAGAGPALAETLSSPLGSSVAPRNASFSKSDAILGGSPSRLAAILAGQGAQRAEPSPAANFGSYGAYAPGNPRIVPDDRPDVFGSVALAISHTSLDRRWAKVERTPIGAAATTFVDSLDGLSPIEQLDAVNRFVNARVRFINDTTQFGSEDLWLAAADTLRRGRGDCEDFAIAKLQLLRHAGFAEKDLYLVILRDARRNQDHAVLVVRADSRLLVLDNGTNRIVDSDSMPDYRPILTFSGNRSWTHGYRRAIEAPVTLAEAKTDNAETATVAMASASLPVATLSIAF